MEYIQVTLSTILALAFGVGFGFSYLIVQSRTLRDQVIEQTILVGSRLLLSNPDILKLVVEIRNWINPSGRPIATQKQATLLRDDTVLSIPFAHNGEEYTYLVQYNRRAARLGTRRVSINQEGQHTDLQHHPGIPFIIKSLDLGCSDIIEADEE